MYTNGVELGSTMCNNLMESFLLANVNTNCIIGLERSPHVHYCEGKGFANQKIII